MLKPDGEITLSSIIGEYIDRLSTEIHTSLPGRVESYDASLQKVDVKPLIKTPDMDEEGKITYYPIPVITDVPVIFPGANGFRVTFPIAQGDTVLIMFSEASLDNWLSKGGDSNPGADTRHDLTDAYVIPGLNPFSAPLSNVPTNTMSVGADNTTATIEFSSSEIVAGGAGAEGVVKVSEFNPHVHPSALGPTGIATPIVGTTVFKGN